MVDDSDDEQRSLAQRALLGDLESIRSLLGMSSNRPRDVPDLPQRSIPVLRDVAESVLEQALQGGLADELDQPLDEARIPVLTERADGSSVIDWNAIRARLEADADELVEAMLESLLPELEHRLRDELQRRCRDYLTEAVGGQGD